MCEMLGKMLYLKSLTIDMALFLKLSIGRNINKLKNNDIIKIIKVFYLSASAYFTHVLVTSAAIVVISLTPSNKSNIKLFLIKVHRMN